MIQQATLDFLKKLSKNNNKEWFDKNRNTYETAKEDFEKLVGNMLVKLADIEPALTDQKAKNCIFRIFRDVRFSKDKTPYKAHFGAVFSKGGRNHEGAGYYLHIEPGKNFLGGGMWMPMPAQLKAVRQEIDYNFKNFQSLINNKEFKKLFKEISGEKLVKLPQGYAADNPAIEYLKLKSFTVGYQLDDKEVIGKPFENKIAQTFKTMSPFIDFLNESVS